MSYQLMKYEPRYHKKNRICDGYACIMMNKLKKHCTDIGVELAFCNFHYSNPYNKYPLNICDEVLPTFNRDEYKIVDGGKALCHYKGCNEFNLIYSHQGYFCKDHSKSMTTITLKYVDKKSKINVLMEKLKEFRCRKIIPEKLILDIQELEDFLGIGEPKYLNSPVNLIHYAYCYVNIEIFNIFKMDNPGLFENKNKGKLFNSGEFSSGSSSPVSRTESPTSSPLRNSGTLKVSKASEYLNSGSLKHVKPLSGSNRASKRHSPNYVDIISSTPPGYSLSRSTPLIQTKASFPSPLSLSVESSVRSWDPFTYSGPRYMQFLQVNQSSYFGSDPVTFLYTLGKKY